STTATSDPSAATSAAAAIPSPASSSTSTETTSAATSEVSGADGSSSVPLCPIPDPVESASEASDDATDSETVCSTVSTRSSVDSAATESIPSADPGVSSPDTTAAVSEAPAPVAESAASSCSDSAGTGAGMGPNSASGSERTVRAVTCLKSSSGTERIGSSRSARGVRAGAGPNSASGNCRPGLAVTCWNSSSGTDRTGSSEDIGSYLRRCVPNIESPAGSVDVRAVAGQLHPARIGQPAQSGPAAGRQFQQRGREGSDQPAVRNQDDSPTGPILPLVVQFAHHGQRPRADLEFALPTGRCVGGVEAPPHARAGIVGVDLEMGQPLPVTQVGLAQPLVEDHRQVTDVAQCLGGVLGATQIGGVDRDGIARNQF